jgi:hypothetical protein
LNAPRRSRLDNHGECRQELGQADHRGRLLSGADHWDDWCSQQGSALALKQAAVTDHQTRADNAVSSAQKQGLDRALDASVFRFGLFRG